MNSKERTQGDDFAGFSSIQRSDWLFYVAEWTGCLLLRGLGRFPELHHYASFSFGLMLILVLLGLSQLGRKESVPSVMMVLFGWMAIVPLFMSLATVLDADRATKITVWIFSSLFCLALFPFARGRKPIGKLIDSGPFGLIPVLLMLPAWWPRETMDELTLWRGFMIGLLALLAGFWLGIAYHFPKKSLWVAKFSKPIAFSLLTLMLVVDYSGNGLLLAPATWTLLFGIPLGYGILRLIERIIQPNVISNPGHSD